MFIFFFFQAEDGIRAHCVTGVQTCALPILAAALAGSGIAYGPTFVFGQYLASGELLRLLPRYQTAELSVHAVFPTARYLPSKVRCFIDHVAAEFADGPRWDRF